MTVNLLDPHSQPAPPASIDDFTRRHGEASIPVDCSRRGGDLLLGSWRFVAQDYNRAFRDLLPRVGEYAHRLGHERQQLPLLIARLQAKSPASRVLVEADPAFHTWALGEWLIEESQRASYVDFGRAESLADCAVIVAERLLAERYGGALINDLRARAWACRGETLRRRSDFREAQKSFEAAESFVARGSGDPLEKAFVLELKAAFYRDRRCPAEAHRALDETIATYKRYGDTHFLGRAFAQKGRVYGATGDLNRAMSWLRKGLGLLDPTCERYVDLATRHSLMVYLEESGRPREARFLLKASRDEFQRYGSPLLLFRLRWLEGKIYEALSFPQEAERALREARSGFIELEVGFSAAAVSLDLASLCAGQGRISEVRCLAEEILAIFQSRDLEHEAIAALIAFRQAASLEISDGRLADLQRTLDLARQEPALRSERA
jgi:tetratricopeptide (TPR) repeat protein